MSRRRTLSSVTGVPMLIVAVVMAAYAIFVAFFGLSWWLVALVSPLPMLIAGVFVRARVGTPPTILGNRLPTHYEGRRYLLVAMPINHFGERLRWMMDLLDIAYDETNVAGLSSLIFRGRTVPWLVDRQAMSIVGNSREAICYLAGVEVPVLPEPLRTRAQGLLERSPERIAWEPKIDILGHAIQGYIYHHLLGAGGSPKFGRILWGSREPQVPWDHRLAAYLCYPLLVAALKRGLKLRDAALAERRRQSIVDIFDDIERALASHGGDYIFGDEPSYVDISLCALLGAAMPNTCFEHWARGRFSSFTALGQLESEVPEVVRDFERELTARPAGAYVRRTFERWRHRSLLGD